MADYIGDSVWAEIFNSVKRIEIIEIMWSVSSLAENLSSRDEFTRLFPGKNFHVRNFRLIFFLYGNVKNTRET